MSMYGAIVMLVLHVTGTATESTDLVRSEKPLKPSHSGLSPHQCTKMWLCDMVPSRIIAAAAAVHTYTSK